MSTTPSAEPPVKVKGEHIFPATIVEPLAIRWKELTAAERHSEAQEVLEDIVIKSTPMFMRLAQYEGFHHTVDLDSLVSAAQARTTNWLLYWDPKKGKLFSWMSKCAKHVFLSEVARASQHRKRFHATSDSLEKFVGAEDHEVARHEAAEAMTDLLKDLSCRWGDKQSIMCIRYCVECIVENPKCNKKCVIRGAAYVSGLSTELAKFFYNWALYALRDAMFDRLSLPYTEQDLFRLSQTHTFLPDLLSVITWKQMLELIAKFGGTRFKIPTIAQVDQFKQNYKLMRDMDATHLDPDSIARVAKAHRVSSASAQEIYERMAHETHADRSGDHSLYD